MKYITLLHLHAAILPLLSQFGDERRNPARLEPANAGNGHMHHVFGLGHGNVSKRLLDGLRAEDLHN
jgi:hypothetical protein